MRCPNAFSWDFFMQPATLNRSTPAECLLVAWCVVWVSTTPQLNQWLAAKPMQINGPRWQPTT
jgi:hypothetical protein